MRPLTKFDYSLIGAVVFSIVTVVVVNFLGSYGHIYLEEIHYGGVGLDALLAPVGIDGLLLALGLTNVFATIHGRGHWLLRVALAFVVGCTVAVNGAYGAGWGITGGLLATWSPVALFIAVESGLYVFKIMSDIWSATARPKRGRPVGSTGVNSASAQARAPRTPRKPQTGAEVARPMLTGRLEPVDVLNPFEDTRSAALQVGACAAPCNQLTSQSAPNTT